jgi:hypothetical protein
MKERSCLRKFVQQSVTLSTLRAQANELLSVPARLVALSNNQRRLAAISLQLCGKLLHALLQIADQTAHTRETDYQGPDTFKNYAQLLLRPA